MKKQLFIVKTTILLLFLSLTSTQLISQTLNSYYQTIVNKANYDSLYNKFTKFESFGNKGVSSTGLKNSAKWIISYYKSIGYTNIVVDTFTYDGNQVYNIVVTKTGTSNPNKYFIVGAHYDAIYKGADDNGSGTCALMEIARVMKNVNTKISVKFIHFTAEEVGLIGSERYVNNVVIPTNMNLKAMLNLDMIAGEAGVTKTTVLCERDESGMSSNNAKSAAYTDTLANLTNLYSDLNPTISNAYSSDYMSFENAGKTIMGLFEGVETQYYHTTGDIVANLDVTYALKVNKIAIAATMYFSEAYNTNTSIIEEHKIESVSLFPNPCNDYFKVEVETFAKVSIYDITGKLITDNIELQQGINTINTSNYENGVYFIHITENKSSLSKMGKLIISR